MTIGQPVVPSALTPHLQTLKIPHHVAIIMDGNGRWARQKGWHRSYGHIQGSSRVKEIVTEADRIGISVLTLFCFSTENWQRPADEISALMEILQSYLLKERQALIDNNIRLQALGEVERIPDVIRNILRETIEVTKNNSGMILNFCISYGGRSEIVRAVQTLCREVLQGTTDLGDVNERAIAERLYTAGLADPDLVIRTSGEFRVSNFLLWQMAYAEFYVTETLWPDFEPRHLVAACEAYAQRRRRFGTSDEALPG